VKRVLTLLIRNTYSTMANPSKDDFHTRGTSFDNDERDPVAVQPRSEEKANMEAQNAQANTTISKELEVKQSKTPSTVSLDQRSTHDEEKGLPVEPQAEKEPAVTDAEHDPDIVDWDGETDPENPLNWSPRKKWYADSILKRSFNTNTPSG
jgi:hypothetical protein